MDGSGDKDDGVTGPVAAEPSPETPVRTTRVRGNRSRWKRVRVLQCVPRRRPCDIGMAHVDWTLDRRERHRLVVACSGHHGRTLPLSRSGLVPYSLSARWDSWSPPNSSTPRTPSSPAFSPWHS